MTSYSPAFDTMTKPNILPINSFFMLNLVSVGFLTLLANSF